MTLYCIYKKSAKSQLFSKMCTAFEELTPDLFLANVMSQDKVIHQLENIVGYRRKSRNIP